MARWDSAIGLGVIAQVAAHISYNKKKMIIPNKHTNKEGDIVFEITHLSESSKELKKDLFDRKTYNNWITIDPITNLIIKSECDCYDFTVTKGKTEPCKHLRESIGLLINYGFQTQTADKANLEVER